MKKIHCSCFLLLLAGSLSAQTVVNGFGAGGWYSWDSRGTDGVHLFGTNHTNPEWNEGGVATADDDVTIANQIKFLGEGLISATVAGVTPDASPTGSLNGLGYVRLDGTGANAGKSDLSYVDTDGIAASSDLLDAGFSTTYRYFSDSSVSSRRMGLNIEFTGHDSLGAERAYVFVFVQPAAPSFTSDAWNTVTVDGTSLFYLYGGGGTPNGTTAKTLNDWANDSTWGSLVFVEGAEIFRVGFNLGSSQRGGLNYIDWVQTSLLDGGATIDFQAAAIPEPGTTALAAGGMACIALVLFRRRRPQSDA